MILYADDTAIFSRGTDVNSIQENLSKDFDLVSEWLVMNKLTLNVSKTKSVLFGTRCMLAKSSRLALQHDTEVVEQVDDFKYLGITLDKELNFESHLSALGKKISSRLGVLGKIRNYLPLKYRIMLYNALVLPHFDYASTIWSNT